MKTRFTKKIRIHIAPTPIIITVILTLAVGLFCCYLIKSPSFNLTDYELVSSLISLFACLGAFISAVFLIYSSLIDSSAFLLSQKPSLLIQVLEITQDPQTCIMYRNTTKNEFNDLTIIVKLKFSGKEVDISDLFTPKMFMASEDSRTRRFETRTFLSQRGVEIDKEDQVRLTTHYTFTFNNKFEERNGPEYLWNSQTQTWDIA